MLDTFQSLIKDKLLYDEVFSKKVKHSEKSYPANVKVISQGDTIPDFYYIVSGSVRIVVHKKISGFVKPIKTSNVLGSLGPGEIFGLFSMFDESPAGADLYTESDAVIMVIDKKSFLEFLSSEPDFGFQVLNDFIRWLVQRLRQSNEMLVDVASRALVLQNKYRDRVA